MKTLHRVVSATLSIPGAYSPSEEVRETCWSLQRGACLLQLYLCCIYLYLHVVSAMHVLLYIVRHNDYCCYMHYAIT